jgi:Mrp family chromosome partitioning ATPase
MTTLDRAFIRAFDPSPDSDSQATPVAPPHAAPRTAPAVVSSAPASVSVAEPGPSAMRQRKPLAPPRPLSSFAPQPKVHDACRALLEVDRLEWPAACLELIARATSEWEHFAEQLVNHMSQRHKCVALTGAERGVGRTTVTLAAARQLASRGLRPVVVDADLENPTLIRGCGVSVQTGWDDLVTSELGLGEALIAAVEDGVTLLPWRGGSHTMAQLAGMLRTGSIFGTLREQYDLVLLDTLPLVGRTAIADFAAFAAAIHLDAVYVVHHVGLTSREQLTATCSKLRRAGVPLTAIIENFAPPAVPLNAHPTETLSRPLSTLG